MSVFETTLAKINAYKNNGQSLLHAHLTVWENGMIYSGAEFKELIFILKEFSDASLETEAKSWQLLSEGTLYTFYPGFGNALEKLKETEAAFKLIDNINGQGAAQALMTLCYKNNGQLETALELAQNAIKNIGENKYYTQFLCIAYYQSGEMHHLLKDYSAAINSFTTGLKYSQNNSGINSRLLVGLGSIYKDTNELEKALEYFEKALILIEGQNNNVLESKIFADIGNYYFRKGDDENAILYQKKSINIRLKHQMKNPLSTNYLELAELYLKQNKLQDALNYALQAEILAKELNIVIKLCQVYLTISSIYEAMTNTALALEYYKKYYQTKEEVFSQESARKIKQLSMRHEMETMETEKELFKLRNVVLKEALDEISASVRYAQRIQEAILPPIDLIKEKITNCFVLYKPKDVVAGDFYWMEEIGNTIFIAAADCTGHGVPGAMVSVVCSNALNRAVKEFDLTETGRILDKTCELVVGTFVKSNQDVKDGMDISLLSINKTTKKAQWSGANNPLWYFENGNLIELKADKQPIGKSDKKKPFTTHNIEYKPGTVFYLFTDGYADQFGGEKGKKFMLKQLQDLLAGMINKEPKIQEYELNKAFENWKGAHEQVDDVCIIGLKL